MSDNPIDIYNYAIKNNKLKELIEHLKTDEDLLYSFLEEAFYNTDRNFLEICKVTSDYYLSKKFDKELVKDELFQSSDFKKTVFNRLFFLETNLNPNISKSKQLSNIKRIIDLTKNPDMMIGIHRTGGQFGKQIMNEGLILTGHMSSGVENDVDIDECGNDLVDTLERNISFEKNGALLVRIIATGGNYKMGSIFDNADIVVVGINKKDLIGRKVLKNDSMLSGQVMLKPEYIFGYVNVDNNHISINNIFENPLYKYANHSNNLDINSFLEESINYMNDKYDGSGISRIKYYLNTGNKDFLTRDNGIRNGISTLDQEMLKDYITVREQNSHNKTGKRY